MLDSGLKPGTDPHNRGSWQVRHGYNRKTRINPFLYSTCTQMANKCTQVTGGGINTVTPPPPPGVHMKPLYNTIIVISRLLQVLSGQLKSLILYHTFYNFKRDHYIQNGYIQDSSLFEVKRQGM